MTLNWLKSFSFLAILTLSLPILAAPAQTSRQIACNGGTYSYLLYTPDSGPSKQPLPAIMILHGAGGHAENFIENWKAFSRKENVAIIAPELPRKLEFEAVAPAVFRCVLSDAGHLAQLDGQRIYLFGHSMGGYLAYDGAMFDSDIFAAVAVHAMGIEEQYFGIVKKATRKTPIAIYIGDRDPFVQLAGVRKTRDLLQREGFPVQYQELKGHDHNYSALADQINADAWKFFQQQVLPLPRAAN
jgi:poly(3-hydroxybutyrate) depolymerase